MTEHEIKIINSVNYYIAYGITIGIAYAWTSYSLGLDHDECVNIWLKWSNARSNRIGPFHSFVDWRNSSLYPLGFDSSNWSQL